MCEVSCLPCTRPGIERREMSERIIKLGYYFEADASEACCGEPEQVLFGDKYKEMGGDSVVVIDVKAAREICEDLLYQKYEIHILGRKLLAVLPAE